MCSHILWDVTTHHCIISDFLKNHMAFIFCIKQSEKTPDSEYSSVKSFLHGTIACRFLLLTFLTAALFRLGMACEHPLFHCVSYMWLFITVNTKTLSPKRPGFDPTEVHVEFVVERLTQVCNFVEALQPPSCPLASLHQSSIFIHSFMYLFINPFTINKVQFQQMKCHKITNNMAKP